MNCIDEETKSSQVPVVQEENIPRELRQRPQWVTYESGTKIPLDPRTGRYASTTDSLTWGTFEEALRRAEDQGLGVGFVFSSGDPFVGVDLDECRDPESGEVAQWAQEIIEELDSYTEASPSGTGVHVITKGKLPKSLSKALPEVGGKIEMYSQERFFTVTGNVLEVEE
jgi:putative DNA primase/helicase